MDASYGLGRAGELILILTRPSVGITFSLDHKNIVETLTTLNYRKNIATRMFHELVLRDHEDGPATEQPQGVGPEAYLDGTSQGELVLSLSKEQPRTHGRTVISVVVVSNS